MVLSSPEIILLWPSCRSNDALGRLGPSHWLSDYWNKGPHAGDLKKKKKKTATGASQSRNLSLGKRVRIPLCLRALPLALIPPLLSPVFWTFPFLCQCMVHNTFLCTASREPIRHSNCIKGRNKREIIWNMMSNYKSSGDDSAKRQRGSWLCIEVTNGEGSSLKTLGTDLEDMKISLNEAKCVISAHPQWKQCELLSIYLQLSSWNVKYTLKLRGKVSSIHLVWSLHVG